MSNSALPPFLNHSEEGVPFYTLAYCRGHYPRDRDPISVGFLSIDVTTSSDFTRYSLSIRNADGHLHAYRRGDDAIDSLEYTLLVAAEEFGVSAAYWQLYPLVGLSAEFWSRLTRDHDLYLASRGKLCRILWHFRIAEQSKADVLPLFKRDPDFTPPSLIEENLEGDAVEISGFMNRLGTEEAERSDA